MDEIIVSAAVAVAFVLYIAYESRHDDWCI